MNSYIFGINGSWFVLILSILTSFLITYFYYRRTNPQLTKFWKSVLFVLRAVGLSLLLIILFEPVLSIIRGTFEKPKLAILIDNSLSMTITDTKGDRKSTYLNFLSSIKSELENSDYPKIIFDQNFKSVNKLSTDSLRLNGQLTDISKPLEWINQIAKDENIQSILILTDGNYNSGKNPIYEVETFGKPVYAVGIGDTNIPKDLSVSSIITNEIVYVNNSVPVNVNINLTGYTNGKSEIKLFDNGQEIGSQILSVDQTRNQYTLTYEYKPLKEGTHKLTVRASSLDGELTLKNNTANEFVNVLKNKRNYLIFAGSPSSDLSFFKNSISHEIGVEIKSFVYKNSSEFYEGTPGSKDINSCDVIVFIGFPIQSTQTALMEMIKTGLQSGKPLLFIASQNVDYSKLKIIEEYLPFTTLSSRQQEFSTIADFKKQVASNPILKTNSSSENSFEQWNQLPPIFRTETFVKAKPESEVLAMVKVNNVTLNEPLILTRQFMNKKSVAITGYGIYRWKLLGYAPEAAKGAKKIDLYDVFMQNSLKWLSVEPNKKNLIIRSSKKIYSQGERVEFYAQLYDASMNPIDNANVNLNVTNGKDKYELTLNSIGNGRYTGFFESLAADEYYYSGEATLNQTKLGSDNGKFNVGELSLEYSALRMNIELLKEIAKRSGGKYYDVTSAENCINDIKAGKYFQSTALTLHAEIPLWNIAWILGIAIVIFALEWFLRKRFGLL